MRVARMVFCPSVLLLVSIVAGCATNGKVVRVRMGDLKLTLGRDGELIPADPVELKFLPEAYEGVLRIEDVVENGKAVTKGDVLLRFEKEKAKESIETKELELKEAKLRLQDAKAAMSLLDVDMELALLTADKEAKDAKKGRDAHIKTEIPLDDDERAHQRQYTEDSIEQQKEEIEQLGKMYSEDELTEETEEIVLKRAKRRLERTIAGLKLSDRRRKFTVENERPKKIEDLDLAVRSKSQALKKLRNTQRNQKTLKQAALQKQEMAVKKQTAELPKLRKDLENFVIRAPIDGILLHGKADAQTRTILKAKDSCKPYTVLLTIVKPGQVKAQCMIEEKDRFRVQTDMPVKVRPVALPGTELSGSLEPLDPFPAKSGQWKALTQIDKADPKLVPGMKCKVEITLDVIKNVLMIPKAGVVRKGGKSVCHIKKGLMLLETREVEVGKTDGNSVVIHKGLEEGEEIFIRQPRKEKGGEQ